MFRFMSLDENRFPKLLFNSDEEKHIQSHVEFFFL